MRTKTDYQDQVDAQGRKKRVKIGLAPAQRDGLEYEFDLVGYLDEDNSFVVDKTRCPAYSQKALAKPDAKASAPFVDWLNGAARGAWGPPHFPVRIVKIRNVRHPPETTSPAERRGRQKNRRGDPRRSGHAL